MPQARSLSDGVLRPKNRNLQLLEIMGHAANGLHIGLADGRVHLVYLLLFQFMEKEYHFADGP